MKFLFVETRWSALANSLVFAVLYANSVQTVVSSMTDGASAFADHSSGRHRLFVDSRPRLAKEDGGGDRGMGGNRVELGESRRGEREQDPKISFRPAPCTWALVACCAPTNYHFRFGCFPYLGCPTLFWETDPCHFQAALHAAEQAVRFYRQFDQQPASTPSTPPSTTVADTTTSTSTSTTSSSTETTTLSNDPTTTTAASL